MVVKGQPDFNLASASIVVADLDECAKNFKQLREKRPAGPERDKLAPKDYWEVLGKAQVRAKSDADGKFKVLVPAKQPLLLCVFTHYTSAGGEIMPYCWMIRLNEAPVQNYDLSNRNHLADGHAVEDLLLY